MLIRAEIPVICPPDVKFSPSWGSLFHGSLMELLPLAFADQLHQQGLKPLAQYLYQKPDGKVHWVLSAFSDEMSLVLDNVIFSKLPMTFNLRQKGFSVNLATAQQIERSTYKELADRHFLAQGIDRRHRLRFRSPTTFKTGGATVLFPSADLIMNSLMQRWDAYSGDLSLADPEVRKHLGNLVMISDYRLASASFSVNSAWMKGFVGYVDLYVKGPEALGRIASLLLDFGRFAGVGVKPALGMGGISIE